MFGVTNIITNWSVCRMSDIYSDDVHKHFKEDKPSVVIPKYIGFDPKTQATIIVDSVDVAKKLFNDVPNVILLEIGGVFGSLESFLTSIGFTETGLVKP